MKLVRIIGILTGIASVLWLIFEPGFEPLIVLLGSLFAYGVTFMSQDKDQKGLGGQAIVGGTGSKIKIQNEGAIEAGSGGIGGQGGDAIHVADGAKINIINNGTIKGGDAGN